MTEESSEPTDLIESALDLAVQKITGLSDARARPTQLDLANHIANNMEGRTHAIGKAGTGTGKALSLDTLIPTPVGMVPLRDITLEHQVFTPKGTVSNIAQIHDTITDSSCYEITFNNGERIVADGNHLWPLEGGVSLDPGAKATLCSAVHSRARVGDTATVSELYELTQGQVPLRDWQRIIDAEPSADIDIRSAMQKAIAYYGEDGPDEDPRPLVVSTDALYQNGGYGGYLLPKVEALTYPIKRPKMENVFLVGRNCANTGNLVGATATAGSVKVRADFLRGILDVIGEVSDDVRGFNVRARTQTREFAEYVQILAAALGMQTATVPNTKDGTWHVLIAATSPAIFFGPRRTKLARLLENAQPGAFFKRAAITSVRPVKSVPVKCLTIEDEDHLFLVGRSMVPTHNSLAYLVPAAMAAAKRRERSVISTESLGLQAQIINKDAPVVADSVEELTEVRPTFALLKGWSNYACERAARQTAAKATGLSLSGSLQSLIKGIDGVRGDDSVAAKWALEQYLSPTASGDKDSYPGPRRGWESISVTPGECPGKKCPFWEDCKPKIAKERAMEADIIITNHSMLAVQAAKNAPVIIGNKSIGRIDHIVADECHGLPGIVRSQGAGEISGRKVRSIAARFKHVMPQGSKYAITKAQEGEDIANAVAAELSSQLGSQPLVKVEDGDPTADFAPMLISWLLAIQDRLNSRLKLRDDVDEQKLLSRISAFRDELREASSNQTGVAKWIEKDRKGEAALLFSPVYVGGKLKGLWEAPEPTKGPADTETPPRSVSAVSATVLAGFGRESGLVANVREYPSPFVNAYARSAMYIPRANDPSDIQELRSQWDRNGKPAFSTEKHREWATKKIIQLVKAAGGRALILSAKADDGKHYASTLSRAVPHITVLSQWDDKSLPDLVREWKEDETSVLVGTKSLATGTDAPGKTNSLVIIDRIPRSPSNPVDDARRDLLIEQSSVNKWVADRLVYAADAALLIEQSAGRLIRTATDRGMVAILDPRLLGKQHSVFNYPKETGRMYIDAAGPFAMRTTDLDHALSFLQEITGE